MRGKYPAWFIFNFRISYVVNNNSDENILRHE